MSLLDEAFEKFTIMNKVRTDDGYGGVVTTWTEGATVEGAMVLSNSPEIITAQAMGATNIYVLTVRKDTLFDYHDVIKRQSDNKIFRVTTDSDDLKTPASASLNMRQYNCEAWTLS